MVFSNLNELSTWPWCVAHFCSDGETFISADDLRINLWNLEISNQSFNIVDVKPANMEDLTGKVPPLCVCEREETYFIVGRFVNYQAKVVISCSWLIIVSLLECVIIVYICYMKTHSCHWLCLLYALNFTISLLEITLLYYYSLVSRNCSVQNGHFLNQNLQLFFVILNKPFFWVS